ncbi:uncharacterized protein [Pyrus communis]|uniref:uncharacterized protein n=1 Tax=Pyrus communis TaxID=23211 RepID=UPI0035C253E1
MPFRVRENLFIGNISDAAEILQNGSTEITHILSLLSSASISFFFEPFIRLKQHFFQFSESKFIAFSTFFACVHCSAAIITAYLMRTEHLSQEDALKSLRQICKSVCPNDGFLDQLKMYENMGFKVDHASPIYRSFHLKVLGESYHRGNRIDSSIFGADPGVATEVASGVEATSNEGKTVKPAFRCKKCRRVVALQDNVVDHIPGEGEQSFGWHKRKSSKSYNKFEDSESECSSIFVEPLKWMAAVEEGAMEGKLSCVHCKARLGYFNWAGTQCSCGSWITPAFQLHKSRVDVSTI